MLIFESVAVDDFERLVFVLFHREFCRARRRRATREPNQNPTLKQKSLWCSDVLANNSMERNAYWTLQFRLRGSRLLVRRGSSQALGSRAARLGLRFAFARRAFILADRSAGESPLHRLAAERACISRIYFETVGFMRV